MSIDLKSARLNKGLSLSAMEERTGVPKSTIARAETGVRPNPDSAKKIADEFGLTVTECWPVNEKAAA